MKRWSIAAVVVLAFAGLLIARRRPPPKPRIAPALVFRPAPATVPVDSDSEDRAAALAVASLSPADRKQLLETMDYATTRLEGPLLGAEDFGEGDPVTELQEKTARYQPALAAARSLVRGRWSTKDLSTRTVASCDDPSIEKDETCVPLWGTDHEGSRARFLAWAASNASLFETDTPNECTKALRDHLLDERSPIALVLDHRDLALEPIPERDSMKDSAHRLGRALAVTDRKDEGRQLDALGRAPPARASALPWLETTPKTVMVVPRLSALSRLAEVHAAIRNALACRPSRWIHPPL